MEKLEVRRHEKLPKSGQFVLIWKFNDQLWSETVKIVDGETWKYVNEYHLNEDTGEYEEDSWHKECFQWVFDEYPFIFIRR